MGVRRVNRVFLKRAIDAPAALGVLALLVGAAPQAAQAVEGPLGGGETRIVNAESHNAALNKLLAKKLFLEMEGETIHRLLASVQHQTWSRIYSARDLKLQPISVFANPCTLAELRDAFADLFGYTLATQLEYESLVFGLTASPDSGTSSVFDPPKPAGRSGLPDPKPAAATPVLELLKPLAIPSSLPAIDEEDLFLPAIQQRIAKIAGIRIFSDYADRTEEALGDQSPEAFFRSLDGLPLGVALDKIAARFDYSWRKSRGWYLFRSRHYAAELQAFQDATEAGEGAESEDEAIPERIVP